MPKGVRINYSLLLLAGALSAGISLAQEGAPAGDQVLNSIREMGTVGAGDARRIGEWVKGKVTALEKSEAQDKVRRFIESFEAQRLHRANTAAFVDALAEQTATVAREWFAKKDLSWQTGMALGRVLVSMDRVQTIPAFLEGLGSRVEPVRYLSAKGLVGQQDAIAANRNQRNQVVAAVKDAGQAETKGVILQYLYSAIAYRPLTPEVFDAYVAILDARLARRRAGAMKCDGGEIELYEFFRTAAILDSLNNAQKTALVQRLAVLLRMDAQRYGTPNLDFIEQDHLERCLEGNEAILTPLAGPGGNITQQLSNAAGPSAVLQQMHLWVGNQATGVTGKLSGPPWNIPDGAP